MANIHATAVVDPNADLGADVEIGPFCVVGSQVKLGRAVVLHSHVAVTGKTTVGDSCQVFPFASIGHIPQDQKFHGEQSSLEIGSHTVIREHVTINPGTEGGGLVTRVGSHCLLMVGAHVAHDCQVGEHVILVNNATLAGHVSIGNHAILGGLCAVHQFVRIGAYAFVGGASRVAKDIAPFLKCSGNPMELAGINGLGLERQGFDEERRAELKRAYKVLFRSGLNVTQAVEKLKTEFDAAADDVRLLVEFVEASERGIQT